MKKLILFIFAAFIAADLPAVADPSATVMSLMNTPVSLFSLGLIRVEIHLRESLSFTEGRFLLPPSAVKHHYFSYVGFDWEKNQINIQAYTFAEEADEWNYEDECRQVLDQIRTEAGINPKTGKPAQEIQMQTSIFANYFSPNGYAQKNPPEQYEKTIDAMIHLRFWTFNSNAASTNRGIDCEGRLIEPGYSVKR